MVDKQQWHVGKEIPIATIVVLLAQTAGALWWAASIAAKVDYMERVQSTFSAVQSQIDKRQDDEARRSEERIVVQLDKLNLKLDRALETRRDIR